MARLGPDRRGHGEAEDRRGQFLLGAFDLLQPPRRRRQGGERGNPRGGRAAVRDPHHGALRLHHQRRSRGNVSPAQPRPDRQRHRGRGAGRAARRHGVSGVLRQDAAGPADGRGAHGPSDHHGGVRLSAERRIQGQARRYRGRFLERGTRARGQAFGRRSQRHERERDPRAGRVLRHGHGQFHARGVRGARHDAAGRGAGRRQQPAHDGYRAPLRRAHRADGVG